MEVPARVHVGLVVSPLRIVWSGKELIEQLQMGITAPKSLELTGIVATSSVSILASVRSGDVVLPSYQNSNFEIECDEDPDGVPTIL